MNNCKPLISVIVPVYNTEKYLEKCIESIINQTYSNLEIIIVNDCSSGNTKEIVDYFLEKDPRIKYIEHEENKGLFHARITGSENATGEYIAFVDSDDYISIDYYRLLVNKSIQNKADIVEGRIIREDEQGNKFIQNNNNIVFDELDGESITKEFFSQEGLFYHWHVIWNKLYSKVLWDRCLPIFKKQTKHLIMTEDLIFSSILFCNAKKYSSINYDGYFYLVRSEASTGSESNINKFIKNFNDMGNAFDFVESYLKEKGLFVKYGINLYNWKKRYFRLWANRIESTPFIMSSKKRAFNALSKSLKIEKLEPISPEDYYHSIVNTSWNNRYEELKQKIADKNYEFISFDIFDTLIVRSVFEPRDILLILNDYFHQLCPETHLVEFSSIRLSAEEMKRQQIKIENPSWEDTNLDEIYQHISDEYSIPINILNNLKEKEIELEIKYSNRRESIYELYEMAIEMGKKVVFISDMYLSEKIIKLILDKCGYTKYLKLFVSSETRVLKQTGSMFKYVLEDLKIEPKKILHIGDNWNSDKLAAEKNKINAFFIPKTTDLLINNINNMFTGDVYKYLRELHPNNWINLESSDYLGTKCMLALVANKLFDNPFPSFNASSNFNVDPYFIGYYALGMHLFALCKWLIDNSKENKYDTMHFMARDGYLPYKVMQIFSQYYSEGPNINYLYASRKSLLPFMLLSNDRYGLSSIISIFAHTPQSILDIFNLILKEDLKRETLESKGLVLSKNFTNINEFNKFIDIFVQEAVDHDKLMGYLSLLREYFSNNIKDNDAIFDLGYSGRLHTIIVNIISKNKPDAYFVHTNKEDAWKFSQRNDFNLKTFYEFRPTISGILREHIFAELGPSCCGYEKNELGEVIPIFESYYSNQINNLVIQTMHKGCLDFTKDMLKSFFEVLPSMKIRNAEVSVPFESFIHASSQGDRSLLKHSYTDDQVHGGSEKNNILRWWERQLERMHNPNRILNPMEGNLNFDFLHHHSITKKIIFYSLFDRNSLKVKVKNKLEGKHILKMITLIYRLIRKIKRILVRLYNLPERKRV